MRIKNFTAKASLKVIATLYLVLLLYLIGYILAFTLGNPQTMFQSFLDSVDWYEKFWIFVGVFVLPILCIFELIYETKNRNNELKSLELGFKIKYIDFLQGRIEFVFNDPKYNIVCGYEEIKKLEMILHTVIVHTKCDSYPAVREIELRFSVLNDKPLTIKNVPNKLMSFIYSVIDYSRNMQAFSYKFEGVGVVNAVEEKIKDYLQKGHKQILSTEQEDKAKFGSILFFAIWMFLICYFLDIFRSAVAEGDCGILFIFVPFSLFFAGALIYDIYLIIDKINDKRARIKHKSKELIGKIPCELIVSVQFIIVAIILFIIFKPLIFSVNDNKILKTTQNYEELRVNSPIIITNQTKVFLAQ